MPNRQDRQGRLGALLRLALSGGRGPDVQRSVCCYHCQHLFALGRRVISTSCPGCRNRVIVEDVMLKKNRPKSLMAAKVQTCGQIVVPARCRLVARLVDCGSGIHVRGCVEAAQVTSGKPVFLASTAVWRGDLTAPAVVVEAGAVISGGCFQVRAVCQAPIDTPANGQR